MKTFNPRLLPSGENPHPNLLPVGEGTLFVIKIVLAIGLLSNIALAVASPCDDQRFAENISQQAKLHIGQGHIVDCKILPQTNHVILAYQQNIKNVQEQASEDPSDQQFYLLTVDQSTQQLIDYYKDPDVYYSDVVGLNFVQLDIAPYQLNAQLRAVGLRLEFSIHSSVNTYRYSVLNLYDLKNKKKILNQLLVNRIQGESDGRCNAEYATRESILVLRPSQQHGIADLKVTTKSYMQLFQSRGEECDRSEHHMKKIHQILKFDGSQYVIPKSLKEPLD